MKAQGFPFCCGAAIFCGLYDIAAYDYKSFKTLAPDIEKFKKEGAIPSKIEGYKILGLSDIGGNLGRTVDGHTRRVAIAITNPVEEGQEKVLLEAGGKMVATFNGNSDTPLKVWIIPLVDAKTAAITISKE